MGRLNGVKGWCQKTTAITDDYIQVDMGALHTVCAIATQGKKNGSFVKSYKLSFSYDESSLRKESALNVRGFMRCKLREFL